MSDLSDSSFNEEWEQMNESDCCVEVNIPEELLKELKEKIAYLEEENRKKDEQLEKMEKDLATLKTKVEEKEMMFDMNLIEEQLAELEREQCYLNRKALEVSNATSQKGVTKQETTISQERQKPNDDAQKLVDLTEKTSKDEKETNEKHINDTEMAVTVEVKETPSDPVIKEKKGPLDDYLGTYMREEYFFERLMAFDYASITIGKSDTEGYCIWMSNDGTDRKWPVIFDGRERNAVLDENNVLTVNIDGKKQKFELWHDIIEHNQRWFQRVPSSSSN